MKKVVLLVVIFLIAVSAIMAQSVTPDTNWVKKYYLGGLYSNSVEDYHKMVSAINIRAGIAMDVPVVGKLSIHNRLIYEAPAGFFASDLRMVYTWNKSYKISVGYLPTLSRAMHTPHPVSGAGHFLPPCKKVINPGNRPGLMMEAGHFAGGVYADGNDSINAQLGVIIKNPFGYDSKVLISAFGVNKENATGDPIYGGAITVKIRTTEVMAFYQQVDAKTYSGLINQDLPKGFSTYLSVVYKDKDWGHLETGVLKFASRKMGAIKLNFLYGIGYQKYPVEMTSFYLRTSWEK